MVEVANVEKKGGGDDNEIITCFHRGTFMREMAALFK